MSPTPLDGLFAFLLLAWAYAFVTTICVAARLTAGAPFAELVRTRFNEVPTIRGFFHFLRLTAWLAAGWFGLLALTYGFAFLGNWTFLLFFTFAWTAAASCGCVWLARRLQPWLLDVPDYAPEVSVHGVDCVPGIDHDHLDRLGTERFPQMIAFGQVRGLWVRGALVVASLLVFLLLYQDSILASVASAGRALAWPVPRFLALALVGPAGIILGALLLGNRTYNLVSFPVATYVTLGLGASAFLFILTLGAKNDEAFTVAFVLCVACAARWLADLWRAWNYHAERKVTVPIADEVARAVPRLADLNTRQDCRLPGLDQTELARRIGQGCRNVEEASFLVTRCFARFFSLVRVEHERFSAAMVRFLTVRRYVTLCGGGGTYRGLQSPTVPIWNEQLFPLDVPRGYVNWLDPLGLSSEWDVVEICGSCWGTGKVTCSNCGGSGRVRENRSETTYSNGTSTTTYYTVENTCMSCGGSGKTTCSPCGGCGRREFQQVLNTQWQRLLPTTTAPGLPVPELIEDAEERAYFSMPYAEDRTWLAPRARQGKSLPPDVARDLGEAGLLLRQRVSGWASEVEGLHGNAILYRAEFRVCGFHVMRIAFTRLRGGVGWFFGARPEFYFPQLPFSWGMLGALATVPPLAVVTLAGLAAVAAGFASLLPAVPK